MLHDNDNSNNKNIQKQFILIFWLCCVACGILVPNQGSNLSPPALEAQSLNHWTAKNVP